MYVLICVSVLYVFNCIRMYKHRDTMVQEPLNDFKICIHNHDVTLKSERMVVCGSLHVVVGLSRSLARKRMPRPAIVHESDSLPPAIVHESIYSRDCCHQTWHNNCCHQTWNLLCRQSSLSVCQFIHSQFSPVVVVIRKQYCQIWAIHLQLASRVGMWICCWSKTK